MSTYDSALAAKWLERILGHEGGFQDNAKDPGNWTSGKVGFGRLRGTKWGISAASYPSLDIPNLTIDQAVDIYQGDFLEPLRIGQFADGVGFQVFDAAVNSGHGNAARMVQRAVGVKPDGNIGPATQAAIAAMSESDFIMRFLAERLDFMTSLSGWDEFGRGWARRIAANLRHGADDS